MTPVRIGVRAIQAPGQRWNPKRKLKVLAEIEDAGPVERLDLMMQHGLTTDEVQHWRAAYERHGLRGLSIRNQENRR